MGGSSSVIVKKYLRAEKVTGNEKRKAKVEEPKGREYQLGKWKSINEARNGKNIRGSGYREINSEM